jgi:hypothetical protein
VKTARDIVMRACQVPKPAKESAVPCHASCKLARPWFRDACRFVRAFVIFATICSAHETIATVCVARIADVRVIGAIIDEACVIRFAFAVVVTAPGGDR